MSFELVLNGAIPFFTLLSFRCHYLTIRMHHLRYESDPPSGGTKCQCNLTSPDGNPIWAGKFSLLDFEFLVGRATTKNYGTE